MTKENTLLRAKHLPQHLTEKSKSDNVKRFELITGQMSAIYARKNKDYGNSFDISLDEDGLLVSKIRLGDKMKRFSQLINNTAEVKDESIRDTLIDMANYAIMTVMWMDNNEEASYIRNMLLNTFVETSSSYSVSEDDVKLYEMGDVKNV